MYRACVLLAPLVALGAPVVGTDHGTFALTVDGREREYHLVALSESAGLITLPNKHTIELLHGPTSQGTRLWISKDGQMNYNSYPDIALLGRQLSYTIDLSAVPCSCNAVSGPATHYTVLMI